MENRAKAFLSEQLDQFNTFIANMPEIGMFFILLIFLFGYLLGRKQFSHLLGLYNSKLNSALSRCGHLESEVERHVEDCRKKSDGILRTSSLVKRQSIEISDLISKNRKMSEELDELRSERDRLKVNVAPISVARLIEGFEKSDESYLDSLKRQRDEVREASLGAADEQITFLKDRCEMLEKELETTQLEKRLILQAVEINPNPTQSSSDAFVLRQKQKPKSTDEVLGETQHD